jgi:hypothetical protein
MVVLNFTLTPEAASKVHDLLICLGKFSDTVAIEARRERVCLRHFYLARDLSSHFRYPSSASRPSTHRNLHTPLSL